MSAREWKPGDVAIAGVYRIFCHEDLIDPSKPHRWIYADGSGDSVLAQHMADARPLVTIDPEDREQVERLRVAFREADCLPGDDVPSWQHTLREFANPKPLIEEPTGLGAVVEDAEGNRFIRYGASLAPWIACASNSDMDPDRPYRYWSGIDAVRVLSEGVPS